ncbi:PREDICTED: signal-regulatory protein delta-like isoform X2 [Pseudopodoces humilis]|uniref:signal-regulatory protein delta-like isoform X2 n=1 Tax=Pseudopodoces humilis TaxID=181119 RepID=UPI0006B864FD|nr:PREDICTED: signal-regulatory protein delta-like isoform X2 [Pseudopodoces humilis]
MAAAAAPLLPRQRSPVQRQLLGVGAQVGQGFGLQQPQDKVSVAAGQMLTLRCTVPGHAGPGPVKWLKGWGSGNKTVYDQKRKDPSSRVTRAVNESNTDFTINIRNFQPNDVGTYYCVKFVKGKTGEDEVFQHGSGTEVSMYETALVPGMVAAAVVLCFLLLLGLFIILCMYRRKRQGGVGSPCPARTVAMGSFLSVPLQCCAGSPSTPSEVLDAESSHLPSQHSPFVWECTNLLQQSSKEENNIHYADLQPLPPALRRGRSPGTAPTEYASLRAAAK